MTIKKVFYFVKESYGGANTFAKVLYKIRNRYIKTRVFSFEKGSNHIKQIVYLTNDRSTSFFPSVRKFILFIKNIFLTLSFIKKERPKIIISGDNYSFILLNIIKPFLSYNPVFILRVGNNLSMLLNAKPFFLYRKLLLFLVGYFVQMTECFIYQTEAGRLDFIKNFKPNRRAKKVIIYNGIDLKKARILGSNKMKSDESQLFRNNAFKIISVGRFDKQKDFFTLIKAFKFVHDKIPKARLFLIGDGKLRLKIERLVNDLRLNGLVFLLGWKENIFPYLKRADLFVHSSFYEGFPFAILEAMSQKLPIISTDTRFGPREALDNNKYGLLVPIGNYKQMAKKIIILLRNNVLRKKYSTLSYKRVHFFSEEKMIKEYIDFFKEIL